MKTVNNPRTGNLIVLSVKIRKTKETISYLFPLNPSSLTINQQSRVSSTFTYGDKVFQNLGAGLKTLSFEGHTGYKINKQTYGLKGNSDLSSAIDLTTGTGKQHWLDLYALVQLIKGENKYLSKYIGSIKDVFSADNIDGIENVQVTIPDQGVTYDVFLQNDSFMRNREQPHLYKYKLDFIIAQEGYRLGEIADFLKKNPGSFINEIVKWASKLKNLKEQFMSLTGLQAISDAIDDGINYVNEIVKVGNYFITSANSTISDLRRLERMTDIMNTVAKNISLVRGIVTQLKTFSSMSTAFYEPYIALKQIKMQARLLHASMIGEQKNLAFNVNLTRLASTSEPVTLASNKATVAQFEKDIRKITSTSFPFPVETVEEVTTDGTTKINVFFKASPSSLGISSVRIYAANDFGREFDLVESFSDSKMILSTNYNTSGYLYNFVIEYNYTTFESIIQSKYKSIKRILIQKGNTIDSVVKDYAPNEANSSRTYLSEIAYLNEIEYPYVVTSDNLNFDAFLGSYGYKIFSTQGEFLKYVNNIDITSAPAINLKLYSVTSLTDDPILDDPRVFTLQQKEVIDQIKTGSKFFVLLFKETYSSRCYAVFGIINNSSYSAVDFFAADSYVICSLGRGHSYDVEGNFLFEILSPYTLTGDLVDYYDERGWFDSHSGADVDLFDTAVSTIEQIYINNVGSFIAAGDYPFTNFDPAATDAVAETTRFNAQKTFLAGNENNQAYIILTTFTATGAATSDSYAISSFSNYNVLTDGEEILLPSLEDTFLPFAEAFTKEDTYKVDLDVRFQYFDDRNISIIPRPDLGATHGYLDFKLISGVDNVKQAIKNRLECPQGGLILHTNYGLPVLIGKKNTLENLILLRYNLFNQLLSDSRIRSARDMQIEDVGDAIKASARVVLVNNDDVLIKTTL